MNEREGKVEYRNAKLVDIPGVATLQEKYHVSTIMQEDRPDGFCHHIIYLRNSFRNSSRGEDGLAIACDGDRIVAYAMAASWNYWSAWPLFQHMIQDLPNTKYLGQTSPQRTPTNMDLSALIEYRGTKVLPTYLNSQGGKWLTATPS